ncbi:MAG: acyloxyacyl hydrolase [bacterium]
MSKGCMVLKRWAIVMVITALVMGTILPVSAEVAEEDLSQQKTETSIEKAPETPSRYHENAMEISFESANLFAVGHEIDYHIAPQILSVHWQLDDVGNEGWLRGNTEWVTSVFYTPVINGPENRMVGGAWGPRYNFVQPGWKLVPYMESRVGFLFTDSTDVYASQGQDFCFTFMVGVGARYDFNAQWSVALTAFYQHISSAGLSEPDRPNYGLDAIGPNVSVLYKF